jgi:histidine ammonia-lyase
MTAFRLGGAVRLEDLVAVATAGRKVVLPPAAKARMARARKALEKAASAGRPIYGVNTGFGELASVRISPERIRRLNLNYIRSHSAGVGEPLPDAEARGIIFLRANELARGFSACRPEVVERLVKLLNRNIIPLVPSQGSVGASGDLAPMAHIALALIGEGEARKNGKVIRGRSVLKAAGIKPLVPEAKEGLSLTNGTQAMQSLGGLALARARRLLDAGDVAAALSLEAIKGSPAPFDKRLHALKPHPGQLHVAARLRRLLATSEIRDSHRDDDNRVQDPYSFRCVPQIHGAARDALAYAEQTVIREMNSATDNPVLAGGDFISGGNFHGMAIAMALDHAANAMAVLGGVSERRVFYMTLGRDPGLTPFLARNPGIESGMMIPQYVAAALASENKTLAHPASADSVPTSADKEDYVSMGMWGALKLQRMTANVSRIMAIEFLTARRGLSFHEPLQPARRLRTALRALAKRLPTKKGDTAASKRIERVSGLILGDFFGGFA